MHDDYETITIPLIQLADWLDGMNKDWYYQIVAMSVTNFNDVVIIYRVVR